jgi:hypothetical protein
MHTKHPRRLQRRHPDSDSRYRGYLRAAADQRQLQNVTASLGPHSGLRGRHAAVTVGYHLSKRHWNTITLDGSVPDDEVLELIGHPYDLIPVRVRGVSMRFTDYSFGSIRVDGVTYDHDLVIDRGKIRKRKKAASRRFRARTGTLRSRPRRTSRGDAAGWLSAPAPTARCRCCSRSGRRSAAARSTSSSCPRRRRSACWLRPPRTPTPSCT